MTRAFSTQLVLICEFFGDTYEGLHFLHDLCDAHSRNRPPDGPSDGPTPQNRTDNQRTLMQMCQSRSGALSVFTQECRP